VFARIDNAQSARDSGLELNPLVLILFGNPKAETPLMAQSSIGTDWRAHGTSGLSTA
jgi:uncharacterized protein (DUF302 family)